MTSKSDLFIKDTIQKLEYYCAYQERCHLEVHTKLQGFALSENERNTIVVHLIDHNFLNEERFALVYTISKFHQKNWGKIRIKNELKARRISEYLINKALKEIALENYLETFYTLASKHWDAIAETNLLKKRKKFCDYLIRKGWESNLVYEFAKTSEE